MRYLIVGGTSIFGEPLVDILLKKDTTEEILATKLSGEKYYERKNLNWKDLDLRNSEATNELIKNAKVDVIFDFATQDSVGYAWEHPGETVDVNVIGTINLLNAIRDAEYKPRVIIGGSGEEYGRIPFDELPIKEDVTPRPVNIFGATKACQTMFAKLYARAYGMDVVVLRTFNETSVKQDDKWAISSFCHQFVKIEKKKQEPVIWVGNINNQRDFTDVVDLSKAFAMVAEKGRSGEIYNAALGESASLRDVIDQLEKMTGIHVEIKMDAARVRPIDSPATIADVTKIHEETGWKAEVPMHKTLEDLLAYWRNIESREEN